MLGHFFIIRTDHKSIKELFHQVIQTPEQQAYVHKLMGFHFRIEFRSGKSNLATDALSRIVEESTSSTESVRQCMISTFVVISEVLDILHKDNTSLSDMSALHKQLNEGKLSNVYSCKNGLLYFRQRLYISPHSQLLPRLLEEAHYTPMAGHAGVKGTLVCLAAVYFRPKIWQNADRYVASCVVYQQAKYSTQPPAGLLQPLPPPAQVWEALTMDFITGLPLSRNYSVIMWSWIA